MSDVFVPIGPQPDPVLERAAAVLARDETGRVLAQLRDELPDVAAAGQWGLFGGHTEGSESLRDTAVREFLEETGVLVNAADLRPLAKIGSGTKPGLEISIFELMRPMHAEQISLAEGAGFAFLTRAQIGTFDFIPTYTRFFDAFFD